MPELKNRSILQQHTARILRIIREEGPVTRVDLAQHTGFDSATVTKITKALIRKRLIHETALGQSTGGRRPKLLEITTDAYTVIGVNVDQDFISIQSMGLSARPIKTRRIGNPEFRNPDKVLRTTQKAIAQMVEEHANVLGVGVAFPGIVNSETGVCIYNAYFGWHNVPVRSALSAGLSVPVKVENDVRSVALGEQWFGAARSVSNMVCLRSHMGVGAAVVVGGEVLHGAHNMAGELGHTVVAVNGPLCVCGSYGCLEAIASVSSIVRNVKQRLADNYPSMLGELPPERLDYKAICRAAKAGDKLAVRTLDEAAQYLAIAIGNAIDHVDPEMILLCGSAFMEDDYLYHKVLSLEPRRSFAFSSNAVAIERSKLDHCELVGAATLILKDFFSGGGTL